MRGFFEFRRLTKDGVRLLERAERLERTDPLRAAAWRASAEFAGLLERATLHREAVPNTLPDEGQEAFFQALLQNAAISYYMGLASGGLTEGGNLAAITGEPSGNGYARQQITRDSAGWPTIARNIASDHTGTAQAGGNTTITLAAGASAIDGFYAGCIVETTGGTGPRQRRLITAYAGATKVVTVGQQWTTNPDATTTYTVHSDFMASSKAVTFSASGGSWGPVDKMFLCNVASGAAGKLLPFAALSAPQTPGAGESFNVVYKLTLKG